MPKAIDHYEVLGVSPGSDDVVIRAAFKALMLKYHPDTNPSPDATRRAAAINAAFDILGDTQKRATYDRSRAGRDTGSAAPGPPPPPPPPPPTPPSPPSSAEGKPPEPVESGWKNWADNLVALGVLLTIAFLLAVGWSSNRGFSRVAAGPDVLGTMNTNVVDMNVTAGEDPIGPSGDLGSALVGNLADTLPSDQAPTPVNFDDVESAVGSFYKVLKRRGIFGARAYSEQCHKKVDEAPSWAAADRCAAFDYAAAYLDGGVADYAGVQAQGYFRFAAENQSDRYASLNAPFYSLGDRLTKIRKAAEYEITTLVRAAASAQPDISPPSPDQADSPPASGNLIDR